MERIVERVKFFNITDRKLKKVAAYARVSTNKDTMLHSLAAQVSFYSTLINKNSEWTYVGVYTDEAITGTKSNRKSFQRMLSDCRLGKIDLIITKSISRFARNTVTLLETVRQLKKIGVDVYFEEQNIHTMSSDGELMLTILASYAQEESLSVSDNCKWRIRNNFKEGVSNTIRILGYDYVNGKLVINEKEANIVRMIFSDYISGIGRNKIANKLTEQGVKPKNNGKWDSSKIREILKNEKYVGDMILQKQFVSDHINKRKKINKGDLPMYEVTGSHPYIINREDFDKVQVLMKSRKKKYCADKCTTNTYKYTGRLICGICGNHYHRKINNAGTKYEKVIWICDTYNTKGKFSCPSKQIPEVIIDKIIKNITFTKIIVLPNRKVIIHTSEGKEIIKEWSYK